MLYIVKLFTPVCFYIPIEGRQCFICMVKVLLTVDKQYLVTCVNYLLLYH